MTKSKKRFFILICIVIVGLFVAIGLKWDALVIEYKLWRDFKSLGQNEQGYPEYEHQRSGIVMVLLPGGEFMMGSPEDELGREKYELLPQKVAVNSFLIAKFEVSQKLWEKVMGSNPSFIKGENLPVDKVTWEECFGSEDSFCKQTGLTLPSEIQWEYACRAGTTTPYSFGEKMPDLKIKTVYPVDSHAPNGFGLFNMHGNVSEWCEDIFNEKAYNSVIDRTIGIGVRNRLIERAYRGGKWLSSPNECRSSYPDWGPPGVGFVGLGFRPVYSLNR